MGTTARAEQVGQVITEVMTPRGLVVEDVTVTPAGKRRLVRVLIDTDVTSLTSGDDLAGVVPPLSLDAVADATRAVSDALDASDAMGDQPYVLEVSSPGTDRPLTQPRHFRRNVGRLVEVAPVEGEPVTGRILAASETAVTLEVDGAERVMPYEECGRARVQVEFNRASGPDDGPRGGDGDEEDS
ncbi:ribosome maturation factor RimP [Luteipulveratus sp. YIM 133132]|uniref:Ribosome maturation factor RimP n=1 Tax=Luteipulveratus flavus TaxID=3031728 RepID=A0ABT6C4R2_9MICO|nr:MULTISPECIES: ribosome maturation factor RimP [unclassified Luteipulveratus]MDE9367639.1 ribosome maturation factor RimP [Luteipulveratus sp. YIM 133132]MDF8263297.1 ribosome maturation factor RimP [Luteipulveratus sp. YIM 133296]